MRSRVTAALASLVLFLCLAAGAQGQPCTVPLVGFGPIDPADGFPQYYLDSNNLALAQCLDSVCDPAFALPDPGQPITFPDNFPADFFYHRAQASMNGPNGQTFLLDIALLGSFINGTPVDGDQIVFSRLRVRATGVVPGATYTITHPFGVETVTADGVPPRLIDFTRNIGRVRLAFGLALNGDVGPFLTFLAGAVPPAPGTIGTGAADQTVTGSACGTNLFKVEGPDLPVGGIQTGLFNNVVGRRAELCGNSFVDLNEDCDLGAANGQPGSCCNANCTFTSATTACDDGNPCTTSAMCDGQGSCPVTGFTTIACTDNNACTTADTCDGAGNCAGGPPPNCDDANVCTTDACDPATGCTHTNNTAACDDGSACTTADTCAGGSCAGGPPPNCNDGNGCTADGCDPASGCTHTTLADLTACEDGNLCTQSGACLGGTCIGSNPIVCTAQDQCHTIGVCDPASGVCSNPAAPDGTSCSDSNACTQTDTCAAGACTGANPVVCAPPDQCHEAGICDPATGTCTYAPKVDGSSCNDGNGCTQSDTCQAGVCTGANPVVCSALDQCHVAGTCDPASGTCSTPNKADGTACTDGNACTQSDTCQAGTCTGANPVVCTALDQCHDAGTCDPANGTCSNPTKVDGTTCTDGNACTQTDTCQAGACAGANPVVCAALDQCHDAGTCDPANGTCSNPSKAEGATCSDGNGCTQTDTCQAGACVGANPVVCAALDQCHAAGTCDPANGSCSNPEKPNGSACSDGDACTQSDSCQAGACIGTNPVVCAAPDQCHVAGTCDPASGTCSTPAKPDGTACNDSSACTQSDSCQAGICTGANPVVCAALDQCHEAGVCDPANGTCSTPAKPNGIACTDGDACTQSDTCQGGTCVGTNPVVCAAPDQCHLAGTCDPASGVCSNPDKPNGSACTDGDACTQSDTCQAGACVGANPVACAALDQCHVAGACDPANGVCSNPDKANGSACTDGDACTRSDTCQAGTCIGANPLVCAALDQCHVAGVCDPANGTCSTPAKPNGSACTDGDACTQTDTCQAGTCVGTNPVICTALDQCHVAGSCDPASGTCSTPSRADGTACNDGNVCTQTDTCQAGTCTGSNPVVCPALDQCHDAGTCNPANGVCSTPAKPNGSACTDGDACTQTDICQGGSCVGTDPVACPAPDQCHDAGLCNSVTGICSNPSKADGVACDDGLFCSVSDACTAGVCGGAARDCSAFGDQCTDGTCNEAARRCEPTPKPDGTACSDGDGCTQADTCAAGLCVGANPVVCAPQDACHSAGVCDSATGSCSNPTITCTDGDPCTTDSCDPTTGCVYKPATGLEAATCLIISPAFDVCRPIPPAIASLIAQAQNRLALAHVDFIRGRQFYGQASHLLKGAAKKARKLARTGRLAPDCAGALNRNLLEASGRLAALRQAL
ncbi:MAG: hypothetical protein E6J71_00230 [Deltaproteobacteria bacterium]|nr:MAG: hypothetical protein E6J71_00230 [Deltaproteobacteria bacterium]